MIEVISVPLAGPVKLVFHDDVTELLAPIRPRGFKLDWPKASPFTLDQMVNLGDRIAGSGLRLTPL